jgi:hypothetical protein
MQVEWRLDLQTAFHDLQVHTVRFDRVCCTGELEKQVTLRDTSQPTWNRCATVGGDTKTERCRLRADLARKSEPVFAPPLAW